MNIRKNARWLNDRERSSFLKAVVALKGRYEQQNNLTMNIYDYYPLEHRIVRRRSLASKTTESLGDGGHGGPAFLTWHREWLRRFERDLRNVDSDVTLPYWDFLDPLGSRDIVFQDDFMGPNGSTNNGEVMSGLFRENVPEADRPCWWPDDQDGTPLAGFPIRQSLSVERRALNLQRFGFNTTTLTRQFGVDNPTDPWTEFASRDEIEDLINLPNYDDFQSSLEIDPHGWFHVWIGGLMGRPATSPNDPMFFLHHCMIDHIWALWQEKHDQAVDVNLPPTRAADPQRRGHNIDDLMWPWDGSIGTNPHKAAPPPKGPFPSPSSSIAAPVFPDDTFLRAVDPNDMVRGSDVIDHRSLPDSMGYVYDTQIPYVLRQNGELFAWIDPMFGDFNLQGTIREQDNGSPSPGDLVISASSGSGAWIDVLTKDLHIPGRVTQEERDMSVTSTQGSWVADHYGQALAYLKPNGNLHLKGKIRTNKPLPADLS